MASSAVAATEGQGSPRRSRRGSSTRRRGVPSVAKAGPNTLAQQPTASNRLRMRITFSPKACIRVGILLGSGARGWAPGGGVRESAIERLRSVQTPWHSAHGMQQSADEKHGLSQGLQTYQHGGEL